MSPERDRRGVTAIEYGILAALIIVALLGILRAAGTNLSAVFGDVAHSLALSNGTSGTSGASGTSAVSNPTATIPAGSVAISTNSWSSSSAYPPGTYWPNTTVNGYVAKEYANSQGVIATAGYQNSFILQNGSLVTVPKSEIRLYNGGSSAVAIPIGGKYIKLVPGAQLDINGPDAIGNDIEVDSTNTSSSVALQQDPIVSSFCSANGGQYGSGVCILSSTAPGAHVSGPNFETTSQIATNINYPSPP